MRVLAQRHAPARHGGGERVHVHRAAREASDAERAFAAFVWCFETPVANVVETVRSVFVFVQFRKRRAEHGGDALGERVKPGLVLLPVIELERREGRPAHGVHARSVGEFLERLAFSLRAHGARDFAGGDGVARGVRRRASPRLRERVELGGAFGGDGVLGGGERRRERVGDGFFSIRFCFFLRLRRLSLFAHGAPRALGDGFPRAAHFVLAPRRLRLGVLGENRRALRLARRRRGRRRERRAVGGGPLRRQIPEPDRRVGGLQRRQRQRVERDVERANELVHAPLVRLAGGFHRVVPPVLPLGQSRVVAQLLRRRLTRRLDATLNRRRELRVVPPRVVQHARQRALAGTQPRRAHGDRCIRVVVVVVGVAVAGARLKRLRDVGDAGALRGSRLRLHGHVRVELPQ